MTTSRNEIPLPSGDVSRSLLLRLLSSTPSLSPTTRRQTPEPPGLVDESQAIDPRDPAGPARIVRQVSVASIDTREALPEVSPELVQSITRHGVLEPVLVYGGHERPRLLSGRRRLAAAIHAGLDVVPAIMVAIDDEEALAIIATDRRSLNGSDADEPRLHTGALHEMSGALTRLGTCMRLASSVASPMSSRVALELMDAEIWRATTILTAFNGLHGDLQPKRTATTAGAIIDGVLHETALIRRLLGMTDVLHTQAPDEQQPIRVDHGMTIAALSGLLASLCAWAESTSDVQLAMSATIRDTRVCFTLEQHGIEVPAPTIDRVLTASRADRSAGADVTIWLMYARRIALAHGGDAALHHITGGSSMTLTLGAV